MDKSRGRGKNKCYWKEDETQLLIQVLRDMARDPLWKTNGGGFRSNYMVEVHRRMVTKMPSFTKQASPHIESKVKWLKTKFHIINEMLKQSGCKWNNAEKKIVCKRHWYESYCRHHKEAKGLWDFRFPFFNQLGLVYGRDRANGAIVEGNHNMEVVVHDIENFESGSENLGESNDSLNDEEEEEEEEDNGGYINMYQPTPTASNSSNSRKRSTIPYNEDGIAKKQKTTPLSLNDLVSRLDGIDSSFRAFVEGFNTNFATLANAVTNSTTNDTTREKAASEKLKDVILEITKLNLSTDDVFKSAEIFAANRNKIDVFFSIPEKLRLSYAIKGFNSNFATMANGVGNRITDDNIRQKAASEKLKDVILEITKLDLSTDDVFKAADAFAADNNKIDVYYGLPEELRVSYVIRLTSLSLSN